MRSREEIQQEIKKLQQELASLSVKFEKGTTVRFRDWIASDDAPMDRVGRVIRHGRKWIEIEADGRHAWAKAEPIGAEPISLGQEDRSLAATTQNQSKPRQSVVSEAIAKPKKRRKA